MGKEAEQRDRLAHAPEIVATVLLVAIACFVFSPGLVGPYLWDDKSLIVTNPSVRDMDVRAWFTKDFWDVGADYLHHFERLRYFRPLVTASYAIEFRLAKGDPLLLHLSNTIAHGVVAALSLFTLRRWTGSLLPALVGALFFALHPTKAESVAWISGRTDVMCAAAILVASLGASRRLRGLRFGVPLEVVGTLVAYMTKEGAIVLPAFVAIEAWIQLGRPSIDRMVVKRIVTTAAPQLVIAIVYLAVRSVWMPVRPEKPHNPFFEHLQMFLESIGRYVALTVAPVNLSSQHALMRMLNGKVIISSGYVALGAASIIALTALAIAMRRRAPVVTMAIGLFGVLILPVSNLILTGMATLISERFLYLPMLAVAWLVAEGATRIRAQRVAAVLVVAALGPLALVRAIDFSDDMRFWSRERERHPESLEAHRFLLMRARDERRFRDAMQHALDGREQSALYYQQSGNELEFIHDYLELRARLVPDREPDRIAAYESFYRALLDPSATRAEVNTPGLNISVPLSGPLGIRAKTLRTRAKVVLAELTSRRGHDGEARALAEAARTECPTCAQVVAVDALVTARSGDYPAAHRLVGELAKLRSDSATTSLGNMIASAELANRQAAMAQGPIALQLRATEFSRLELYGRAYEVLLPHRAQIELAPGFAIGFAELAYRAGDEQTAREVLAKHVPEASIGPMFDGWARKMGWRT